MIEKILEKEEKVLWESKQHIPSAVLSTFLASSVVIALAVGLAAIISSFEAQCIPSEQDCTDLSVYFFLLALFMVLHPIITAGARALVAEYAITTKRIILKGGLVGIDMRSVYYDQLRSAHVDVGIVGKIFGTGTIMLDTGYVNLGDDNDSKGFDRVGNIKMPYEAYKILQETLSNHKESMHSGRLDYTENREEYKDFVQETEKMRRDVK
jgi:hypothetical protein